MATTHFPGGNDEVCPDCEIRTPHDVSIEIVTESGDGDGPTAKFSREPYRVSECQRCGHEQKVRMNNA